MCVGEAMNPTSDKFLKVHQEKLISSQNSIKTSLKTDTRKPKSQKTARTNKTERKSTFNIFSHLKQEPGEDLVLPAVENKEITPKSCLVVDILQLANSYSSNFKHDISASRLSSVSGDTLSRPTLSSLQKQQFSLSVNSAPDVYLKQKRGSLARPPVLVNQTECAESHNGNNFAKSWPLAPLKKSCTTTRLPRLFPDQINETNDDMNDFRGSLAKFNKSKNFRKKNLEPVEEKPVFSSDSTCEKIHHIPTQIVPYPIIDDLPPKQTCGTNDLKVSGTAKRLIALEKLRKSLSTGSELSSLTHVTEEIVEDNAKNDAAQQGFRIPVHQQESIEVNKKCIQWLEGVARERQQNPDKIFLPHLLMT